MSSADTTHFASTERSTFEEIDRVHEQIVADGTLPCSLDAMTQLVFILNQNRQVVFANEVATGILKRPLPEMLGQRLGELLNCENAKTAPNGCGTGPSCRNCGAILATLDAARGKASVQDCRISTLTGKGFEALDLRIQCRPFPFHGKNHVILSASDISSEKRKEVLERIFFHDILNLAGGVQGLATLLADDLVSAEEIKVDLVSSASAVVQEIHSQRMLIAAENAQLALQLSPLSARELLNEVRSTYQRHPQGLRREIRIAADAADFKFTSDQSILRRVLGNLVKNALEASPVGSCVTLSSKPTAGGGVMTCHNPGCMPQNVKEQMFQRSFSTKGQGRGIGTYSIKLLTENYLSGQVSFVSTEMAGTTFMITLPKSPEPN